MSEPLTRYPADQGIQAGWEDAEFYLCSEVDELLARRAPPADLLRGLRDFVADSGISLHPPGCDCCHHQLLARADAYLEGREHPGGRHHPEGREPQNYSAAQWIERCYDAVIHSAEQIKMPDGRKLADWVTLMNRLRDGYIADLGKIV